MGLTLIETAKYETRLEHLAVIKTFAEGELLSWLPFMNIAGGGLFYSVEKELPSVGFRAVNEGYKQSYGVVDPQSAAVRLFGGDVDVYRSIVDLQGPTASPSATWAKCRMPRCSARASTGTSALASCTRDTENVFASGEVVKLNTKLDAAARFSLLDSHPGHSDAVTVALRLAPELRDGTMGTFVPVATVAVPAEGGWLLHHRVGRCHRLHPGGYDPLPPVADPPKPLPEELR